MALEWKKPGESKPEMVTKLEELREAAKTAIQELKKRRELLKEKYSEDNDGEMGTKDIS